MLLFINNLFEIVAFIIPRFVGLCSLIGALLLSARIQAQHTLLERDTISEKQKRTRLIALGAGFAVGYTGGMILLQNAWYSQDTRAPFRFYNDNRDWNQLDKASHMWAAFHQSRAGVDILRWAGVTDKKAIWYGGMLGIVMQTPIELFDGYSSRYGASWGDMLANTVGSAGVIAQELTWGELRFVPKFSYRESSYEPMRATMAGDFYMARMVNDYNGQTFWLSTDVSAFLPPHGRYPAWLNISFGYGAKGMVHADPFINREAGHHSYRQFFLSPDLNLMKIRTRSKFLRTVFYIASTFRIPAPAVEFSQQRVKFHALYY